jgi:beta-lactamase class A
MTTLNELHIDGINVTRSEKEMAIAFYGLDPNVPMVGFGDAVEHTPLGRREMALRRYLLDANNSATPDAMTALLVALQSGRAASPDSTRLLLKWMTDTDTGPDRLRGLLPAGAVVAHKTGTSGDTNGFNGCTNDVGIITLPDGGGHLVVSVFTKGSARPLKERERAIAEIGRLLCVASDAVRDQRH